MRLKKGILLLALILTACNVTGSASTPVPTSALPTPQTYTTSVPDVKSIATDFLTAWQTDNYQAMYDMLTPVSRDALSLEDFTQRYRDAATNLSLESLGFEILSALTNPTSAQVAYRVNFKTVLLGEIQRDTLMNLTLENGGWKIQWDDAMIMPELSGGNRLALDIKVPVRGTIYDRNDNALVAQTDAVALGVLTEQIDSMREMITQLARVTGKTASSIAELLRGDDLNWYVPIAEVPLSDVESRYETLTGLPGLAINNYSSRFYYGDGAASPVTGYVLSISAEELEAYQRKGYRVDEKIGAAGLEKWGDNYLTGTRGASLYVVDAQGQIVTRLSQADSNPSMNIYTTIDQDLQEGVQQSLGGFLGAAVVMEVKTGRILAMVSSPPFDPNAFEPNNYNSSMLLDQILNDPDQPLLNRATQGGYPLGSVFKIITMSAALESGLYTAGSEYLCKHDFTELAGATFYDWTYEHEVEPSGLLTLPQGLMRSCNPWFYHIGLDLYRQNRTTDVSNLARAFGLGSATGIGQVAENVGAMPDPVSEEDAVQMAIGQGTMLVTPLQVVDFIAAIANGGTLYRPQVVEKIVSPNGEQPFTFTPEVRGSLSIKPENLKIVQDAMLSVIEDPRGTAHNSFLGLGVKVYGKTGTAQNSLGKPHAWFAGYTAENREDMPDIAVVVLAENAGEGSEISAPIFRRIVELYYFGKPMRLFPWESSYYVTQTPSPTPGPTETPGPSPTPTETGTPEPTQPG
jgi:penicillin-binding protein 2